MLSSFLVINVITAIVTQQMKQIGIMKSVGATPRQIAGLYFRLVLILWRVRYRAGYSDGGVGQHGVCDLHRRSTEFRYTAFLDRSFGACHRDGDWPARAGAGCHGSDPCCREHDRARGHRGPGTGVVGKRAYLTSISMLQNRLARLPLTRPMRLSIRNTFRRKGRLARTLIPLMLGGAIFITVLDCANFVVPYAGRASWPAKASTYRYA